MTVALPLLLEVWREVGLLELLGTVEDVSGGLELDEAVLVAGGLEPVLLESPKSPPILLKISLANEESPAPVVLVVAPLVDVAPSMLPPLRNAPKVGSPRRESPSREVVVVNGSLADVGGLLFCPDECPDDV